MYRLLLFLFILPLASDAQKIPSRANTITIVHLSKSALRSALITKGYLLVDRDSTYFETLPKQFRELEQGSLIIGIRVNDSSFSLTGRFNQVSNAAVGNPYGNRWRPAVHTALYGNSKAAFEIIDKIAHSLGGNVSYSVQ